MGCGACAKESKPLSEEGTPDETTAKDAAQQNNNVLAATRDVKSNREIVSVQQGQQSHNVLNKEQKSVWDYDEEEVKAQVREALVLAGNDLVLQEMQNGAIVLAGEPPSVDAADTLMLVDQDAAEREFPANEVATDEAEAYLLSDDTTSLETKRVRPGALPSTGPCQLVEVTGAGSALANGLYVTAGKLERELSFVKFTPDGDWYVQFRHGVWAIKNPMGHCYYITEEARKTPPIEGWTVCHADAESPGPTVTMPSCVPIHPLRKADLVEWLNPPALRPRSGLRPQSALRQQLAIKC